MDGKFHKAIERTVDVLVSLTALLVLSPLFVICAILIKTTSKGPVFYKWRIIAQDAKKIVSYKFRTMVENAEQIEMEFREGGNNEMKDVYFKLENDPRVTGIGRFLRKVSIDEIPSLYSVLKGDMTLVGPRPVRWFEYEELKEWHKARFKVKPGLTSPWVVKGKNEIKDFDEIVKLDLEYIANRSLLNNLKIIFKTIPIVLLGRNY